MMAGGRMFEFVERCEAMGPLVRARMFHKPLYVVTAPELIEQVLLTKAKSFHKPIGLRALHWIFGTGLLTANGELWKHRRKLVQPAFHHSRQADYADALTARISRMLGRIDPGELDVHDLVVSVCLEQLMSQFFGNTEPQLVELAREAATACHSATQMLMNGPWYYLLPAPVERRFSKPVRQLERRLLQLLHQRRTDGSTRGDFADLLAQGEDRDGCPMGEMAMRDEAITMILAGHETVTAAVTWALYLLAKHPSVQTRLARELATHTQGAVPTLEEIPKLEYLDKVLKETYRLYPPTHRIGRTTVEPVSLGAYSLPARAEVLIPQWAVHRSPRHFVRSTEFIPDRWSPEFEKTMPRFAYFPFSAGPHVCLGQSMAKLEDAMLVAALVRNYEITLSASSLVDPPVSEGLTLLPCPARLEFSPRRGRNPQAEN
jgi:cytochrome P450